MAFGEKATAPEIFANRAVPLSNNSFFQLNRLHSRASEMWMPCYEVSRYSVFPMQSYYYPIDCEIPKCGYFSLPFKDNVESGAVVPEVDDAHAVEGDDDVFAGGAGYAGGDDEVVERGSVGTHFEEFLLGGGE